MRLRMSLRAAVLSIAVPVFTSSIAAEHTPVSTPPAAITKEYSLSPDGQRLTVVVKASSAMATMKKGEIKRVYERVPEP